MIDSTQRRQQSEPSDLYIIRWANRQEFWTIAAVVWAFSVLLAFTCGALIHHG